MKAQHIILNADKILSEDGEVIPEEKENMERRFRKMLEELFWFTEALKSAREKTV